MCNLCKRTEQSCSCSQNYILTQMNIHILLWTKQVMHCTAMKEKSPHFRNEMPSSLSHHHSCFVPHQATTAQCSSSSSPRPFRSVGDNALPQGHSARSSRCLIRVLSFLALFCFVVLTAPSSEGEALKLHALPRHAGHRAQSPHLTLQVFSSLEMSP